MDNKFILGPSKKDIINQFQVYFMYKPGNKKHNTLNYQLIKSMGAGFTGETLT